MNPHDSFQFQISIWLLVTRYSLLVTTIGPFPIPDFRHIVSVYGNVLFMFEQFIPHGLLDVGTNAFQFWYPVNHIHNKVKTVEIIHYDHIKRGGCGSFFFIATHMKIGVICSPVCQAMNQPRIPVKCKYNGLVGCKKGIKIFV